MRDYTGTFIKQERIRGQLLEEQTIAVKYRHLPFSVAMAWTKNAPAGDRVLYVEGKNGNQMIVRPSVSWQRALVGGFVKKDPTADDVLKSTLRPVTMFGFRRGLENLIEVYKTARDAGDLKTKYAGTTSVAGRQCIQITRLLPPKDDYPCHRTEIHIDIETLLPICIEGYNWRGELDSKYLYTDMKFNVGLADGDFERQANDF